jgi:hypothetical protein
MYHGIMRDMCDAIQTKCKYCFKATGNGGAHFGGVETG